MPDYNQNDKIISSKVDSLSYIQEVLDRKYAKAERRLQMFTSAIGVCVLCRYTTPSVYFEYWIVFPNEQVAIYIGFRDKGLDNLIGWTTADQTLSRNGTTIDWMRDNIATTTINYDNADEEYHMVSIRAINEHYPYAKLLNTDNSTFNGHGMPIIDHTTALELITWVDEIYLEDPLNITPFVPKYYVKQAELEELSDSLIEGTYPKVTEAHMVFWEYNAFIIPDGFVIWTDYQHAFENSVSDQYLVLFPDYRRNERTLIIGGYPRQSNEAPKKWFTYIPVCIVSKRLCVSFDLTENYELSHPVPNAEDINMVMDEFNDTIPRWQEFADSKDEDIHFVRTLEDITRIYKLRTAIKQTYMEQLSIAKMAISLVAYIASKGLASGFQSLLTIDATVYTNPPDIYT